MTQTGPNSGPILNNSQLALVVYILYLAAYVVGITAVIGVIIAHVQVGTAEPSVASHYRYQIRTFWVGLLYLVVGGILAYVLIGFIVLAWWFVWSLVRNIKGLLLLNNGQPIARPESWMFG